MTFVADVFDVIMVDNASGDVIGTTTLQDAQIQFKVTEQDIRGGRGNQLLGTLHSDRAITLSLTDVEMRYDWIAKQLGQNIVTGAGIGYAMPKNYTVSGSSVVLDFAPLSTNSGLAIFNADNKQITGFTVSGSTVDLSAATPTVAAGDSVEVRTYKYNTDPQTQTINIDNTVFANGVTCVLETLEIDGEENKLYRLQWQFTNSVPDGNFTIDTKSQRQAATTGFTLNVIKPTNSDVVGKSLRIPYTA